MIDISGLIAEVKSSVSLEVDSKFTSISKIKRKQHFFKIVMLPFYPVLVVFKIISDVLGKIMKMKKIGFPLRYLKILSKIVSYVKRIEELEKNNAKLEKELMEIKKQWFSGKV